MRNALSLSGALLCAALLPACGGLGDLASGGPFQCDLSSPSAVSSSAPRLTPSSASQANRYVVELGEATDENSDANASSSTGTALLQALSAEPDKNADAVPTQKPERLALERAAIVERNGGRVLKALPRNRVVAELTEDSAEQLRAESNVKSVTLDPIRRPLATNPAPVQPQQLPWGMSAIGATEAWSAAAPLTRGAKVCVIDSGLYASHEDLSPGGGAIDGYPETWSQDTCGHGTHVSGTIAALDNDRGVVGANPLGADLYMVRVFGGEDCGWTYGSELADAIDRCVASGAKVINMSLGGFTPSAAERDSLANAWKQGVLVVAAAGNEGDSELEYPASYPSVISVGAIDEKKQVTDFSQKNAQVDLVAPGAGVVSTVPYVSRHELSVGGATFSGSPLAGAADTEGVTGRVVDGGACTSSGNWSGAIVVCKRGGNTFSEKVAFAQQGGAAGAVVYNNDAGGFAGTLGENPPQLPAIAITDDAGAALLKHAGQTATLVNEAKREGSGYAAYSGTSMASPHVAGVASFLMGQVPNRSAAQVRAAMLSSAEDLGPAGVDDSSGHGLVRADRALDALKSGKGLDDAAPLAGFLAHCEGVHCSFIDASVPVSGTIASRTYDFGDGTSSDDAAHTFAKAGTYTVTISVIDDAGHSASASVPVSIISATAHGGAVRSDGSRDVELDWSGVKTANVTVLRDGKAIGTTANNGVVVDALKDGTQPAKYRVCSAGTESCSEELTVLPTCGS